MTDSFNPSTQEERRVDLCKYGVSLIYIVILGQPGLPSHISRVAPRDRQKWVSGTPSWGKSSWRKSSGVALHVELSHGGAGCSKVDERN